MNEKEMKIIHGVIDTFNEDIKPVACIYVCSNGEAYRGMGYGDNKLSNIDKLDIILYLIKKMNVNIDDIEDLKQMNDEIKYMFKTSKNIDYFNDLYWIMNDLRDLER